MDHRVGHFNASREAVAQDAASLALEDRHKLLRESRVLCCKLQRGGQLAVDVPGDSDHLVLASALDQQRRGSEYLFEQVGVVQEVVA